MRDASYESSYRTFMVLAAVFIAIRVMLLLFWPETYTFLEELYSGVIARVVHDGFMLSPMEYMWHTYEGGTLIFGISAIPFFEIIGPTYLALKATAVAYSFLTFALWYFLMARFFGRRSALFCGIFFCFSPIGLTRLFFVSIGSISQNPLFDILMLTAFYRFCFADVGVYPIESDALSVRRRFLNACLFGFWGGLGIYFCYFSVITLLACLLTWLVIPIKTGGRKYLWGFLFSLIVGSFPLLFYNSIHPLAGLKTIVAIMPGQEWAAPGIVGSMRVFLRMLLYDTYWFGIGCYGWVTQCYWFVYSALILCAGLWIFTRNGQILLNSLITSPFSRRRIRYDKCDYIELPILIYIILFFAISVGTHLERKFALDMQYGNFSAYRYFSVLVPYIFCVTALFLARLWESRINIVRALTLIIIGSIVFFSILSLPLTLSGVAPAAHHKGYRYYLLGWKIAQRDNAPEAIRTGLSLSSRLTSPEDRLDFIEGFCEIFWWGAIEVDEIPLKEGAPTTEIDHSIRHNITAIEGKINGIDPAYVREFYKALGRVLCLRYIYERDYQVARCISLFKETDPGFRGAVFEGMGQVVGSFSDPQKRKIDLITPYIPDEYRNAFAKGIEEAARRPYIQVTL
ncbi:MAG: hypothetical protein NTZ78_02185 [Candidatus Aureabacteria bacterium]|nr:hypothetical protein [Candidatus Auribacterota bacterium]